MIKPRIMLLEKEANLKTYVSLFALVHAQCTKIASCHVDIRQSHAYTLKDD